MTNLRSAERSGNVEEDGVLGKACNPLNRHQRAKRRKPGVNRAFNTPIGGSVLKPSGLPALLQFHAWRERLINLRDQGMFLSARSISVSLTAGIERPQQCWGH